MQKRARRLGFLERASLVVAAIAIPLFAISYLELRRIDTAVAAGGNASIPYFAYAAIALFVAGIVAARVARAVAGGISRALEAEQQRRNVAAVLDEDTPA
jgi:hypothetical protein